MGTRVIDILKGAVVDPNYKGTSLNPEEEGEEARVLYPTRSLALSPGGTYLMISRFQGGVIKARLFVANDTWVDAQQVVPQLPTPSAPSGVAPVGQ